MKSNENLGHDLQRRQAAAAPLPSFLPPRKQEITPELIQEALSVQPQNVAVISSILPLFLKGQIRIDMQLGGPVATTLIVFARTSFPCGNIGKVDPQPNLALVPLVINQGQGQPQTVVADCECIAVSILQPEIVTYWIQDSDGGVYSVVGNNLVHDIDKMNSTQSTALSLTTLSTDASKRSVDESQVDYVVPEKRQFWRVSCNLACPLRHMRMLKGTDGTCACLFLDAKKRFDRRDLAQPDLMNAKMTPEACAGMSCFNTGGGSKPAVYHPFQETCYCVTQPYIESNPNAWKPS